MPTYTVTLQHRQTGATRTQEVIAPSHADVGGHVDIERYQITRIDREESESPSVVTTDEVLRQLLAVVREMDLRLARAGRRRTGVVSIVVGVALGMCGFAVIEWLVLSFLGAIGSPQSIGAF